jgi:hypothetical protein
MTLPAGSLAEGPALRNILERRVLYQRPCGDIMIIDPFFRLVPAGSLAEGHALRNILERRVLYQRPCGDTELTLFAETLTLFKETLRRH